MKTKKGYNQICAWLGVVVKNADKPMTQKEFEKFMLGEGYKVNYIDEYKTLPDHTSEGGRNDVIFSLHKDDVNKMVMDRLHKFNGDIKWYEDYVTNYHRQIPYDNIIKNEDEGLYWNETLYGSK
tara:strand:- start:209 stop:580 length:372 start_codon:yes stop_codon:yes gene_type:complete